MNSINIKIKLLIEKGQKNIHRNNKENTNTEIRLMLQSKEINSNSCNYCDE